MTGKTVRRRAFLSGLLGTASTPALAWLSRGSGVHGGGGSTSFSLASYVSGGTTGSAVQVTLGWTGTTPSSASASWSGGGGSATISGFQVIGTNVSFYASTPGSAGTYTLSGSGWTTGSVTVTAAVADFSAGITGRSTLVYSSNATSNVSIGNYVARGIPGPQTATLIDTVHGSGDAAGFIITDNLVGGGPGWSIVPEGAFSSLQPTWSITVVITDGVVTYTKAVVITNIQYPTSCAMLASNIILDSHTVPNFFSHYNVGRIVLTGASATPSMIDPSGLFILENDGDGWIVSIPPANLISANFGTYNVTISLTGGSPMTTQLAIGHEAIPAVALSLNGPVYTSTPATNSYGSNQIATINTYADTYTKVNPSTNLLIPVGFNWTSNPTGALTTYTSISSLPPGVTYLTSSVSAGTLNGTCAVTSPTGLVNGLVISVPVLAGTVVNPSNVAVSTVGGLTNYLLSANGITGGSHSPITVATFVASGGFVPVWSLTQIDVINRLDSRTIDSCQFNIGRADFYPGFQTYVPRYAISGSGASGTMTAWNLSAQTDAIRMTLTDGNGAFCTVTFNITAAWPTYSGASLSVGPGGTWTSPAAMQLAMWTSPNTYVGAPVKVLAGCPANNEWNYGPGGGGSGFSGGWWPFPIKLFGDPGAQASFTGTISGTTLTVSSVTGTISPGLWISTVGVTAGTLIKSGSGTTWTVSVSQSVGPIAMTGIFPQIHLNFSGSGGTAPGGSAQGGLMAAWYDLWVVGLEMSGVTNTPGSNGNAGAIYKVGQTPGNIIADSMYFHDNDNAILNLQNGNYMTVTNSLFARCGNNGQAGAAHNIYVGEGSGVVFDNNITVDTWNGHEFKCRAMVAHLSNSKFLQGVNGLGSSVIDLCDGGIVSITNNVIMKQMDDTSSRAGLIIGWLSEVDSHPMWAINELTMTNNVVVNNLGPNASYPAVGIQQFFYSADPARGTAVTSAISNTQFYNLASASWVAGNDGGGVPTLTTGNISVNDFPTTASIIFDPVTGVMPFDLPSPGRGTNQGGPQLGSAPGTYFMSITVPTAPATGTSLTGGLLAAYDYGGAQLTGGTWSFSGTFNNSDFTTTVIGNTVQVKTNVSSLPDGIYYFGLQWIGTSPALGSTITVAQSFSVIVGTGGASDGFANGIYMPPSVIFSPDITTSTDLFTGFVRTTPGNATNYSYSVTNNTFGGSPWVAVTITNTTSQTSTFKVRLTTAGVSAMTPNPGNTAAWIVTITGTDGTTPYSTEVSIWALT